MSIHTFILPASVVLAGFLLTTAGVSADPATPGNLPVPTTPQQKSVLIQVQDAFTNIAQTVEPTVVNIKSERVRPGSEDGSGEGFGPKAGPPHRLEATGSGVIVRADGYILTNDHVVEGAKDGLVTVTLADGREFPGRVFQDFSSDLAVVKINPGSVPLPVAGFADDATVRPGQWAVAIGSPFDLQNTMTVGIISAVGRHPRIGGDASNRYYPNLLQTDAAINPGNSGGPLFNIDGKVVGINVAIESPVEGSAGVGFAIPSSIAQTVMNALIRSGKVTRGYLGIAPEDLTPALQTLYGQKDGALVRDVGTTSPAGRAGIEAGDIVTAYDGRPILGEVSLRGAISGTAPGKTVSLRYVRDGRLGIAAVTLGGAPPPPLAPDAGPGPAAVKPAAVQSLGFSVRTLTAADRVEQGLPATVRGALITEVTAGSPAESAGFSSGLLTLKHAVIQKIGHQTITSKSEYDRAAAALPHGSAVSAVLLYVAEGQDHQREVHQTVLTLQP